MWYNTTIIRIHLILFTEVRLKNEDFKPETGNATGEFSDKNDVQSPKKPSNAVIAALTVVLTFTFLLAGLWYSTVIVTRDSGLAFILVSFALVAFIAAGGITAFLVYAKPLAAVLPACVACLILAAVAVSQHFDALTAVSAVAFALVPFLVGTPLGAFARGGKGRTSAVTLASVLGVIMLAIALAKPLTLLFSPFVAGGSLDFGAALDSIRGSLTDIVSGYTSEFSKIYNIDVSNFDAAGSVNYFLNNLPALLCAPVVTVTLLAQLLMFAVAKMTGIYGEIPRASVEYKVSAEGAVVFGVSFIASFVCGGVVGAVFENLSLILRPVLALAGLISLIPRRYGNVVRVGCLPISMFFIMLVIYPSAAVLFLAVVGTFATLKDAFGKKTV